MKKKLIYGSLIFSIITLAGVYYFQSESDQYKITDGEGAEIEHQSILPSSIMMALIAALVINIVLTSIVVGGADEDKEIHNNDGTVKRK